MTTPATSTRPGSGSRPDIRRLPDLADRPAGPETYQHVTTSIGVQAGRRSTTRWDIDSNSRLRVFQQQVLGFDGLAGRHVQGRDGPLHA